MVADSKRAITVTDAFGRFQLFCDRQGIGTLDRRGFKGLIAEVIREEFGLSLRHDVVGANGRMQRGWKVIGSRLDEEPMIHSEN